MRRWIEHLVPYFAAAITQAAAGGVSQQTLRSNRDRQRLLEDLPFLLSKLEEAQQRLTDVREHGLLPEELHSFGLWRVFSSTSGCRTHDSIVLGGPIMYAIDGLLGDELNAYSMVFEALNRLWAKTFKQTELEFLRNLMHRALQQVHIYLPSVHQDILMHLLRHLVDNIDRHGPPHCQSMFPFETQWRRLGNQNHSTRFGFKSMMMNFRAQRMAQTLTEQQNQQSAGHSMSVEGTCTPQEVQAPSSR